MSLPTSIPLNFSPDMIAASIVFLRLGTALSVASGFGEVYVSPRIRLMTAIAISLVLGPLIRPQIGTLNIHNDALLMGLIGSEILNGLLTGGVIRLIFSAFDTAGSILGFQIGISNAFAFNPAMAQQTSALGSFMSATAITLFFTSELHHMLIRGIMFSFKHCPPGEILISSGLQQSILHVISGIFVLAFHISAPFMLLGLLFFVALGLVNRLLPALQLIFIAQPIQILLGLLMFAIATPAIHRFFHLRMYEILQTLWGGE